MSGPTVSCVATTSGSRHRFRDPRFLAGANSRGGVDDFGGSCLVRGVGTRRVTCVRMASRLLLARALRVPAVLRVFCGMGKFWAVTLSLAFASSTPNCR